MIIKNRTKFVLTVGIGLSLFSGLSHTAFDREDDTALLIINPSAPARLGAIALLHDEKQIFSVIRESGEINKIQNHLVARDLRNISHSEVEARLDDHINFRVQQGSDGEFSLQECGGLEGGIGETEKKIAVAGVLVAGSAAGLYKAYRAFQYDIDKHNEKVFKEAKRDFMVCVQKNPLKKNVDGTFGIPSACVESSVKFKMAENTIKVRLDSSVYVQFDECLRQNSSAEDTAGIPSACIGQLNALKMALDSMKVCEDTPQN